MSINFQTVPNNTQSRETLNIALSLPYPDTPPCEMNETTSRDLNVIWTAIESLSKNWRGHEECRVPNLPKRRDDYWGKFALDGPHSILPAFTNFIQSSDFKSTGLAIDLGCGGGEITTELLRKGWKVIAIDTSAIALNILRTRESQSIASGHLTVIHGNIETFNTEEQADLVVAADTLPYINPSAFRKTWEKVHDVCLKKEGYFVGSLFTASDKPDQNSTFMNFMREQGAWLIHDRRMVRPILSSTGYDTVSCTYRIDKGLPYKMCIQFVAKKL